jgi:hypothetical protein
MTERRSKYSAHPVKIDGYHFDSHAEAGRYAELRILQQGGEIARLEVHPRFELQTAFVINGGKVRPIYYEADFEYFIGQKHIVEDVKGMQTDVFKLKRKMFEYRYPDIELRIVEA